MGNYKIIQWEIKNHIESNKYKNTSYQNLWDDAYVLKKKHSLKYHHYKIMNAQI